MAPNPERTIVDIFRQQVAEGTLRPALRHKSSTGWDTVSWRDYGKAVEETAAGLLTLGVEPGDRVALLSGNRPEWHIADLAVLSVGAITVPVYPTSSSSQVAYVLQDSGARICFTETAEHLAKFLLRRERLPDIERVIGLTDQPGLDRDSVLVGLTDLRSAGAALLANDAGAVERRALEVVADSTATLVYTSGTTGPPKGTMITHRNIVWTVSAVDHMVGLTSVDRFLSYLPLSHIAERVTSHFGQIVAGGETWFAQSLASVPEDLADCRPTIFFAVPRVWQKFHDAILHRFESQPTPVRSLFGRFVDLGLSSVAAGEAGTALSTVEQRTYNALDRVFGTKIRSQLGLDQARFLVSSAAPIHPDLLRWFHALGLPVAEVWGQTEDCGPATVNPPEAIRIGTIGVPLPGLEVRVDENQELLVRGGSVSTGYHDRPEATAEAIDIDGWLHTGDMGEIDDDGYVSITGRVKDLIINSSGKNISPAQIEGRLSMEALIGQAVVVGDGRKYLVALLTLDAERAAEWAHDRGAIGTIENLAKDPAMLAEVDAVVAKVNAEHAPVEQLKRWHVLPGALTIEGNELTPTLKVRRAVVAELHAELIEEMYAE